MGFLRALRRAGAAGAALVSVVVLAGPSIAQQPPITFQPPSGEQEGPPPPTVVLAAVPVEEVRRAYGLDPLGGAGVGVYPSSRDPADFLAEIGSQLPTSGASRRDLGRLLRALSDAGVSVGFDVVPGAPAVAVRGLERAFGPVRAKPIETEGPSFRAYAGPTLVDVTAVRAVLVVGVSERTPADVALLFPGVGYCSPCLGVLEGGLAERRGIVTPYDIAATILRQFDVEPPSGRVLRSGVDRDPVGLVDRVSARLVRDATFGPALTKVTASLGIAGVFFGGLALLSRRRRLASAFAVAGAFVPAGYVAALFVGSPSGAVRAIVVGLAWAAGFAVGLRAPVRAAVGWSLIAGGALVALLTVVAPIAPGGEPALSLWGDPLVSWRFFGLRNHLAVFLAMGAVVGALIAGLRPALVAAAGLVALVVVGAPPLGANFIGVLTLGAGIVLAVLMVLTKRHRPWQYPAAALVAAAGTAAALFADAGARITHGGRTVESIRSGGLATAWDIYRERARLNIAEFADIGWLAWLALVLMLAAFGWLMAWSIRSRGVAPIRFRAAVAGGVLAALSALVLEDSGFLMAGDVGLYPALAWLAALAGAPEAPASAVAASRSEASMEHGARMLRFRRR